jgi:uncharacterized protein YdcH (DUF465 family)
MKEKDLKERLKQENEEFRKAAELHQKYENDLMNFQKKKFMTDEEKLQEKEIKKKKLRLKDKMHLMMEEYKNSL